MDKLERYLGILLIIALIFLAKNYWPISPTTVVASEEIPEPNNTLLAHQPITTESKFREKIIEDIAVLEKKTVYEDDPETAAGEEKVLEEGEDGKKIKKIKITYYEDEEYDREVTSVTTTEPKDKKILRGTKIVWRTIDTPEGEIKYWKKMRVYATHYDSKCRGCDEWTAIGMRAGKGVIAVDPKVIKLRSKVYVPGYGIAVAGDTGGAIKGNIIDLGFDDARTAGWSARYVDIYLL